MQVVRLEFDCNAYFAAYNNFFVPVLWKKNDKIIEAYYNVYIL